jgi:cytochrome c
LKTVISAVMLAVASFALTLAAGCRGGQSVSGYTTLTGGSPQAGRAVIREYNCGACHVIPGVRDANGQVGPPLTSFGRRTFIAGELPNTPDNLVQWIRVPTSVEPKTAMPDLGLTEQQARDAAAYLYTLR